VIGSVNKGLPNFASTGGVSAARFWPIPYEIVHETDKAVYFIGDLREAFVDVIHALFVRGEAFGLLLPHRCHSRLKFANHRQRLVGLPSCRLEVHRPYRPSAATAAFTCGSFCASTSSPLATPKA